VGQSKPQCPNQSQKLQFHHRGHLQYKWVENGRGTCNPGGTYKGYRRGRARVQVRVPLLYPYP
jgi:hypothetical protein